MVLDDPQQNLKIKCLLGSLLLELNQVAHCRKMLGQRDENKPYNWRGLFLSKAKLRASSRTSGLMSGFAMVAMVELNLGEKLPSVLVMTFSLLTTCLISVHVFALMISVCILPNIDVVENIRQVELSGAHAGINFATNVKPGDSPHENLHKYVEIAWIFSTGLGTFLFLLEIPILLWVKLYTINITSAIAASAVMVPTSIIFIIFAVHFYRKLIKHEIVQRTQGMQELQLIAKQLGSEDLNNDQPLVTGIQTV